MTRKSTTLFLEDAVDLLVQHFGSAQVIAAVAKYSAVEQDQLDNGTRRSTGKRGQQAPSVSSMIEEIRTTDRTKHRILIEFYTELKAQRVLPESQDIRLFSQLIGLKEINGKSRKELLPRLMRFLLEQPVDWLDVQLKKAASISEKQREDGYSVLADKLMGRD